jgi:hypothetical protein
LSQRIAALPFHQAFFHNIAAAPDSITAKFTPRSSGRHMEVMIDVQTNPPSCCKLAARVSVLPLACAVICGDVRASASCGARFPRFIEGFQAMNRQCI